MFTEPGVILGTWLSMAKNKMVRHSSLPHMAYNLAGTTWYVSTLEKIVGRAEKMEEV